MHDPSRLENENDILDVDLSACSILYGLWGTVSSFLESKSFVARDLSSHGRPTSRLWVEAQRQEIYQKVRTISMKLDWIQPLSPEVRLISEYLMMSLHVSFEDIQRFAGRYGEDEFRLALPRLQDWCSNEEHYHALWHAGQILRTARSFPPTQLRGFHAIAVYHACLILWVFTMISKRTPDNTRANQTPVIPSARRISRAEAGEPLEHSQSVFQSASDRTSIYQRQQLQREIPKVILDNKETLEVRNFLTVGCGLPCLHVADRIDQLDDPSLVSTILSEILRNNFPSKSYPLPPLLENLTNLMDDLSKAQTV